MTILLAAPVGKASSRLYRVMREAGYKVEFIDSAHKLSLHRTDSATQLVVATQFSRAAGLSVLRIQQRAELASVPLLFVASGMSEAERVAALREGADDVVPAETTGANFLMQVRRMMEGRRPIVRRSDRALKLGAYELDPVLQRVRRAGVPVALSPRQFTLAWSLFTHLDRLVTHELLLALGWSSFDASARRSLRSHIHQVRFALELAPPTGLLLRTVYSGGYRLEWVGDSRLYGIVPPVEDKHYQ